MTLSAEMLAWRDVFVRIHGSYVVVVGHGGSNAAQGSQFDQSEKRVRCELLG